jgi:hypothetical protein
MTSKLTSKLAAQLEKTSSSELLDVIVELQTLGGQAENLTSSRGEKIAALKEAFNRNVTPVEEVIRSVGGQVTGRAWINQSIRARVPAERLRELAEHEKIAAVDVPHVLTPDSVS